jgi:hypothetical protein
MLFVPSIGGISHHWVQDTKDYWTGPPAVGHDMFDLFHAESERILGVGAPVSP